VEEYGALAKELYKLGHKKEARLISLLKKQVEDGDMRSEMQMKYDNAMENSKTISGSQNDRNRQPETPNNDKNSDIER
ncbi:MAG: hypothetical protein IJR44_05810, partial [Neisseriaceae bacterium]|nr:hypothetical protein [Neisseriaceae bacterium]